MLKNLKFEFSRDMFNVELPLFDIRTSYCFKLPEYKHRYSSIKIKYSGWTGRVFSYILLKIIIFRSEFYFRIEWDNEPMSPEEAYNNYHNRRK